LFNDTTGAGAVTSAVAVDIPALTHSPLSIGLRNGSRTVNIPLTKAITVVGDTIPITATIIRLNNTSGGSLTLNSTPTMAAGENGQVAKLINTSANAVVIQDAGTLAGSGLELTAATITIAARQSVELTYMTTSAAWLQTGPLVAVL